MKSEIKIVKSIIDIQKEEQFNEFLTSIIDIQKEEQFNEFLTKLKTDVTFRVLKIEFNNLNHKELTKAEEFVSSIVDETHNYNTVIEILARCIIKAVRNFKEKE